MGNGKAVVVNKLQEIAKVLQNSSNLTLEEARIAYVQICTKYNLKNIYIYTYIWRLLHCIWYLQVFYVFYIYIYIYIWNYLNTYWGAPTLHTSDLSVKQGDLDLNILNLHLQMMRL